MSGTHNDLVSLDYNLSATPVAATSFGDVIVLMADVAFGGPLAKSYTTYDEVVADGPTGTAILDAGQVEAGRIAFAQDRQPSQILFGTVNVTGLEDYDTALQNIIAAGWEFFIVTADLHAEADSAQQLLISADVETRQMLYVMQTDSVQAYDSGTAWDAGVYAALVGRENTVVCWHNVATVTTAAAEWVDVAYAVARSTFDLDVQSPTWTGPIREIAACNLTDANKLLARANNINFPLPFGTSTAYMDPGVTQSGTANSDGRPIDHIVSVYWFLDRVNSRLAALKQDYDTRGEKIPMNAAGQALVEAELEAQRQIAVSAGHFEADQVVFEFPDPIPDADITSRVLKATVSFQLLSGARSFDLTFNFSATAVA